jgi:hypothetical protein
MINQSINDRRLIFGNIAYFPGGIEENQANHRTGCLTLGIENTERGGYEAVVI